MSTRLSIQGTKKGNWKVVLDSSLLTKGMGLDSLCIGVQITWADKVGVAPGDQREGLDMNSRVFPS